MAYCLRCGCEIPEGAANCPQCGAPVQAEMPQGQPMHQFQQTPPQYQQPQFQQPYYQPMTEPMPKIDPKDHTAEFEPEDISDGKLFAAACYLFGWIGLIVAYLGGKDSKFAMFHARQALMLQVVETLVMMITIVLAWTIIVPIAAGIFMMVMSVVEIIMLIRALKGKAKEAPIVSNFKFLK